MTPPIPIQLAVEDTLSEAVLREILSKSGRPYSIGTCYVGRGFGYLRRTICGFNNAARSTPFLVLTDLDQTECPPRLIDSWLPQPLHPNLVFRVAVREVEAWLLAGANEISRFLRIKRALVRRDVEAIQDPKAYLIDLARLSPNRELRSDIVPPPGSTRLIGPNYNGRLISFVQEGWDISVAKQFSPSLLRAVEAVSNFIPAWEHEHS